MAVRDVEDYIFVFNGVGDDGVCTYVKIDEQDHKKFLKPWTKGSQDTEAGNLTFFLMSPRDPTVKGSKMEWHVWCSPFDPSGPHATGDADSKDRKELYPPAGTSEDDLYAAIVHATKLQTKEGRVWTKDIWAEKKEAGEYPKGGPNGLCNPVFCAWKFEGEFYGFTLNCTDKTYHTHDNKDGLHARSLKQRHRTVLMKTAALTNEFQNVNHAGAPINWRNRKAGFMLFNDLEDVTVQALKDVVKAANLAAR